MVTLYAEIEQDKIINLSSIQNDIRYIGVTFEDSVIDYGKLEGYVLTEKDGVVYAKFDQSVYDEYSESLAKQNAILAGQETFKRLTAESVLYFASDADAYTMRYMYEEWKPNTEYTVGKRCLYADNLYKCKQDHTSEEGPNRTPDYVSALWDLVAPEDPTLGTKDNPIKVPEPFSSMEYVKGSYYLEGNDLYLMSREGMKNGDKISLTFKPSSLVGQYFTKV